MHISLCYNTNNCIRKTLVDAAVRNSRNHPDQALGYDRTNTFVTLIDTFYAVSDPRRTNVHSAADLINFEPQIPVESQDVHAFFNRIANQWNHAPHGLIAIPFCTGSHYITIIVQKFPDGTTQVYITDSQGEDVYLEAANRSGMVEIIYRVSQSSCH